MGCGCNDCEAMMQPYLDGMLSDSEVEEAREHLERCPPCDKRFRFEERLRHFVRVAVDELASALIEAGGGTELTLMFSSLGTTFVIEGSAAVLGEPAIDDISGQILSVVVDDFEIETTDGVAHFRASKRSSPAE